MYGLMQPTLSSGLQFRTSIVCYAQKYAHSAQNYSPCPKTLAHLISKAVMIGQSGPPQT